MKLFVLLCALAMAVAMPQMDTLEPYESKGSEGLDREEEQPPKGRIIVIYVPIDADEYDELDYPYDILPEMDENSIDSTEMEIPSYGVPTFGGRNKRSAEPIFGLLRRAFGGRRRGRGGFGRRRGGFGRRRGGFGRRRGGFGRRHG